MKKSILKLAMASMLLLSLSGCNKNILGAGGNYEKIHLYAANKCYLIKELKYYTEQIRVKLTNGTEILINQQNVMLVKGDCPICDHI